MLTHADEKWLAHQVSQARAANNMKLAHIKTLVIDAQEALAIALKREDNAKAIEAAQRRLMSVLNAINS